jgi:hypothetical protein
MADQFSGRAQFFRLAPEYRRCAGYVLVGLLLAAVLEWWINQAVFNQAWRDLGTLVILLPIAIWQLMVFRWRLRVDDSGISRRRLFGWDLWPWEAFETGLIHKGNYVFTYKWPDKPWWQRTLSFGFLEETERESLWKASQQFWKAPPPPELPPELSLRYSFRKEARFSPEGIWAGRRGKSRYYPWTAVQELRIDRLDHDRRDFRRLEIVLPDQTIRLWVTVQYGQASCSWSGAAAEVISGMLQSYVSPERTLISALSGPPKSLDEVNHRLDEFNRRLPPKFFFPSLFALCLALVLFLALGVNVWAGVVSFAYLVFCWFVYRYHEKEIAQERTKLEAWQAEMSQSDGFATQK